MRLYIFCILWIQILQGILCDAEFIHVMQNVRLLQGTSSHGFGYRAEYSDTARLPRFSPPHEKPTYRANSFEFFRIF